MIAHSGLSLSGVASDCQELSGVVKRGQEFSVILDNT